MMLLIRRYSAAIMLSVLSQLVDITIQEARVILLTNTSGEFSSPGYPTTTSGLFVWLITVNEHHRISLQFLDFGLQTQSLCNTDYVVLYDGSSNDAPLIGKWCWDSFSEMKNNTFNSSSSSFYLSFRGHPSFARKGFHATYFSYPEEVSTPQVTNASLITTAPSKTEVEDPLTTVLLPTITASSLNDPKETTVLLSPKTTTSNEIVSFVTAGCGIIVIMLLSCFVAWYCQQRKNRQGAMNSNDNNLQVFEIAATVQPELSPVQANCISVQPLISPELGSFTMTNNNPAPVQSVDSTSRCQDYVPDVPKALTEENEFGKGDIIPNKEYHNYVSKNQKEEIRQNMNKVTNLVWQSFDLENEGTKTNVAYGDSDNPIEMETNLVYQSFDSEYKAEVPYSDLDETVKTTLTVPAEDCNLKDTNVRKSDEVYYYVDEKGNNECSEYQGTIYESIQNI